MQYQIRNAACGVLLFLLASCGGGGGGGEGGAPVTGDTSVPGGSGATPAAACTNDPIRAAFSFDTPLDGVVGDSRVSTPAVQGVPAACASSVRFALDSGSLPPGISLDALSGVLSGTLTRSGSYPFQLRMSVEGTSFSYRSGMEPSVTDPAAFTFSAWETRTTGAPFLDDFRIASIGGTLYVVSRGFYSHVVETYASTDGGANWNLLPIAGPTGDLRRFALASDGTGVYLSGGTDQTGAAYRGVWYFDGSAWSQRTGSAAFPGRESHAMVADGGNLYVLGGRLGTSILEDTWRSTDGGVTWTQASAQGIVPRWDFCAVADGRGAIYVTGGSVVGPAAADGITVLRSTDGATWTRLPVAAGSALYSANVTHSGACALLNGRIVLAGNGPAMVGASNTVSSSDGITWTYEPHHPDLADLSPGAAVVNGRMYVTTGSGTSQRKVVRSVP